MRHSPAARRAWWFTVAVAAIGAVAAITLALFPARTRASSDGGLPQSMPLEAISPESSIFLLADLSFPNDGKQMLVRSDGLIRRLDQFQDGGRVSDAVLDRHRPYCSIVTSLPGSPFVERIKRLQISSVSPLAGGVRITVYSVQQSAIDELDCFSGSATGARAGLTVAILRSSLGRASGDARVAVLGPPVAPPQSALAAVGAKPSGGRGTYYREALTDRAPSSAAAAERTSSSGAEVYRNLEEAHRAYLRYLDTLQPLTAPGP